MKTKSALEDVICLCNELHVTVLNTCVSNQFTEAKLVSAHIVTVVYHLHVVASTGLTHPIAARVAFHLRGRCLENGFDVRPCGGRASRHEGRTKASAFFTAGNTGSDKKEALFFEFFGSADRIRVVGVSTINDDIALLEFGEELVNEVVNRRTGLDK